MKLGYLLVVPLVSARAVKTQQQVPILGEAQNARTEFVQSTTQHVTKEIAPAIGVHFTTSYAVAAARYQNGTLRDLVRVAGDAEYIDLMRRWTGSKGEVSSHDCHYYPLYMTVPEAAAQRDYCNMRSLGRSLGIPTNRDTEILSGFIIKVRQAIETELGTPITSIAPAFPQLSPSVRSDVEEAMTLAALTSTRVNTGYGNTEVYEEQKAAWAGLGHGLCETWTNYMGCASDGKSERHHRVSYFNLDNSSFSVGTMVIQNAFQEDGIYYDGMDPELGWWNLPVYEVPRAKFWTQVQDKILSVFEGMPRPPNTIVLMGDHGADPEFKEVVTAAMWEKFEFDVEIMLDAVKKDDAGKLAARGAAELGWRNEDLKRQWEA